VLPEGEPPVLKEPVMAVEVVTPENFLGDIIGDLNSRRGRIEGMEPQQGGAQVIQAQVPLAEMFGYATTIGALSQGRASYSMEPSHHGRGPAERRGRDHPEIRRRGDAVVTVRTSSKSPNLSRRGLLLLRTKTVAAWG
jgi:translation elongation factor EF-G